MRDHRCNLNIRKAAMSTLTVNKPALQTAHSMHARAYAGPPRNQPALDGMGELPTDSGRRPFASRSWRA